MSRTTRRIALIVALLSVFALPGIATADHSWGGYHWARTTNTFTLQLGDNVSTAWDPYLGPSSKVGTTSYDWTQSTVLDTTLVAGRAKPRTCRPTTGRVEVCSAAYGYNGWLGVAQIWVTGGVHITQGTVKVNDSYFSSPIYNTSAWRNLVMCQEVGHTLGLAHQDETFGNLNLGTCMDYTNDPDGTLKDPDQLSNEHPNQHDYDERRRSTAATPTPRPRSDRQSAPGTGRARAILANGAGWSPAPTAAGRRSTCSTSATGSSS